MQAACLPEVDSFIHSFPVHFPSPFVMTGITLGAGRTNINNACALLLAATGFLEVVLQGRECDAI
jgi:hypothetical protein